MKKTLYTALMGIVLCCFSGNAQTKIDKLSINYGEEITDDSGKIVKIIGEANDHIYTLVLKGKSDYSLKIFDSKAMKLTSNKPIIMPEIKDKDVDFEDVFLLNDKIYVIGSVYHRKDKVFTLVAIGVSDKGILSKDQITLFESKVARSSDRGGFYFRKSPDERMLLVMHTALFDKEDAMKYEIKLFDENMNQAFFTEDKVSFDDNKKDFQFTISDFDVNDNDDVFLVVNEGYRDNKKKEHVEKFQLFLFKNQNNYTKEVVNIDVTDKEIINCKMLSTNNGIVHLTGFYSSVRESGRANWDLKGVYNATVNLSGNTVGNLVFNEFDYATKVKLLGERKAKKGRDVKPLYNIHSIIEKNDGGLIVLSEYQTVYVGQTSGIGPLGFTPITYTTNEIIVTSLKPDGTLDWSNVVPKEQSASITVTSFNLFAVVGSGNFRVGVSLTFPLGVMGKGPEYLSAIPIYSNGELNIVFNDNAKNKGVTDIEKIKSLGNYNNSVPTLFTFDDKGNITRKDPDEIVKHQVVIRPGVYCRKSANEYIIYASRKSQDKLGRMFLD
ncbi:hypothetical protein [Flavobacterium pallidum]|uniref:Uncharacterized protein n=1 Tax=Flavobacterium pallidum TaxID=2172098 RepID=A0A2S1SGI5_9FLAO|nr:hypothetical protein [Flavobacterium pallidum]AWI25510.1 hypothetical protein HYN49_06140 [Flavobacterium pallidum]